MADEQVKLKRVKVEVRSDAGSFLFAYLADRHVIEVHKRGQVFEIPVLDLIEFGRASERKVFRVVPNTIQVEDDFDVIRQGFE